MESCKIRAYHAVVVRYQGLPLRVGRLPKVLSKKGCVRHRRQRRPNKQLGVALCDGTETWGLLIVSERLIRGRHADGHKLLLRLQERQQCHRFGFHSGHVISRIAFGHRDTYAGTRERRSPPCCVSMLQKRPVGVLRYLARL